MSMGTNVGQNTQFVTSPSPSHSPALTNQFATAPLRLSLSHSHSSLGEDLHQLPITPTSTPFLSASTSFSNISGVSRVDSMSTGSLDDNALLMIDPWSLHANKLIGFRLLSNEAELPLVRQSFHPKYTHQIYDGEVISGFKGLNIDMCFAAGSLKGYFTIRSKDKRPSTMLPPLGAVDFASMDDVLEKLHEIYPREDISTSLNDFKTVLKDPWTPPGEVIHSYTLNSVDLLHKGHRLEQSYYVFRAGFDNPEMKSLHERLQFFLFFYIDRASFIDASDPTWEVLLIAEKTVNKVTQEVSWRSVGYTTLYTFLRYPSSRALRISQVLIFPPFQRQGHGHQMLQAIFSLANSRPNVTEVNVEDPAPGFQMLRDLFDVSRVRELGVYSKQLNEHGITVVPPWNKKVGQEVASKLKITVNQVRRCHDMLTLASIDLLNETQYKEFRLDVKRRLFQQYEEELSVSYDNSADRKERLHELYTKLESMYKDVCRKARIR